MPISLKHPLLRFWVATLAALVVAVGTFLLGQWQLSRAEQKTALQQAIETQKQRPALDNAALAALKDMAPEVHRPVRLTGFWAADKTVYLDNRALNGRAGFWVVTPLVLTDNSADVAAFLGASPTAPSQAILVQRGWLPRSFTDRVQLPDYATPAGLVVVRGRLAPPPSQLLSLGEAEKGPIRQNVDLSQLRSETGLPLRTEAMVLQTETEPAAKPASASSLAGVDGLTRAWVAPESGVSKHKGYAFQWFALSALAVGLYLWFQIIAPWRQRRT